MSIIPIKCPSCGAKAKADTARETMVCEYCGTESFVQKREGVLERPAQVPAHAQQLPVATQKHSGRWALLIALIPAVCVIAPITGGIWTAMSIYYIGTSVPVLSDVDGDGDEDVVSFAKRNGSDDAWIGAWDGETGDNLWKSDDIGELGDAAGGILAAFDGAVLFVSAEGKVTGYAPGTGETKWEISGLGEKARHVCAGEEGFAAIELADRSFRRITLADGAVAPLRTDTCAPAMTDKRRGPVGVEHVDPSHVHVGEVRVEDAWRIDERWVVAGYKRKGTRVPTVGLAAPGITRAQLDDHGDLPSTWESAIPVDPMKADTNELNVAVSDKMIFGAYEMEEDEVNSRLTGIAIADGTRKWDVELDGDLPLSAVAYADGRVYVAMWASLFVHDAKTGEHLYTIGR